MVAGAREPYTWLPPRGTPARRRLIAWLVLVAVVLVELVMITWLVSPSGSRIGSIGGLSRGAATFQISTQRAMPFAPFGQP